MTANVDSLTMLVLARCADVNERAVDALLAELEQIVPDSGNISSAKLRFSRVVGTAFLGDRYSTTVTYNTVDPDTALYTEQGTEAHVISSVPAAGGPPLTFYWPKVGHVVRFTEVYWKPGPGVAKNIGWFSRTLATWPELLARAL